MPFVKYKSSYVCVSVYVKLYTLLVFDSAIAVTSFEIWLFSHIVVTSTIATSAFASAGGGDI